MINNAIKHRAKLNIVLSLSMASILLASIFLVSVVTYGRPKFDKVDEHSDVVLDTEGAIPLLDSAYETTAHYHDILDGYIQVDTGSATTIPDDELWNETSMTIYATADRDICVGKGLSNLGDMYWQTSNTDVISGFHDSARTWLGYDNDTCRYPIISGVGTTTITIGTYDGKRRDSIEVTVLEPPVEEWKNEVLDIINNIRASNHLDSLTWSTTCEEAAMVRAGEIAIRYSHTRPDGSNWSTACPAPSSGGKSGENLAIGNAAVSPITAVMLWLSSESHRENILNPEFTKLAVGFVYKPDTNYKTYWSQFFSTY